MECICLTKYFVLCFSWVYHSPEETDSATYRGMTNSYDGSGYYQDLRSWRNESEIIIHDLKYQLWITRATRAVFLDFAVYNANLNLFCIVKLTFEFPPTGGIIPTSRFHTLKLIRYVNQFDYFIFICECIFFVLILYYTAEEIREIIYLKGNYFKHFWNYIDIIILSVNQLFLCNTFNYF